MSNRLYYLHILLSWLLLFAYPAFAADAVYKSEFSTGRYQDNQFNDETLEIPNAYALTVTISGEIENKWDVLTLYNAAGQKIGTFTGAMNERLEVAGSKIRVVFDADNRKHDFLGAIVKIEAQSFPQLYQNIKQALQVEVKQLLEKNTGEAAFLIKNHLKQLNFLDNQVRRAKNIEQVVKPVADELISIAKTYRTIANTQPAVQKAHQETLSQLEKLQKDTKSYQDMAQKNVDKLQAESQAMKDGWRKDNLQRVANLLHTQQTLWTQFQQQQTDIAIQAQSYSNKILDFLSFLDVTAQVYEGTAHLALVRQSSVADLQNLMDLSRLRAIVGEIQQYENKINALLDQIEKNSPLG
ncbi:hypothetical protein [Candidatus Albibeggiatoa sp. nov. NOAA]|uniref:hypothetical protein n=1 Tax=Candidatus Albibeggiatoa sp. nov. NOAA TaxID=3162724 RepID=UPI0032F425DC|nr:hypothetical protein [Thiotrichaceae bacterium]